MTSRVTQGEVVSSVIDWIDGFPDCQECPKTTERLDRRRDTAFYLTYSPADLILLPNRVDRCGNTGEDRVREGVRSGTMDSAALAYTQTRRGLPLSQAARPSESEDRAAAAIDREVVRDRLLPCRAGRPGRGGRFGRVGRPGGAGSRSGDGPAAQAVAMGFRNADAFRSEAALDPLRDREDFRLLVMDLTMPDEPFARGD